MCVCVYTLEILPDLQSGLSVCLSVLQGNSSNPSRFSFIIELWREPPKRHTHTHHIQYIRRRAHASTHSHSRCDITVRQYIAFSLTEGHVRVSFIIDEADGKSRIEEEESRTVYRGAALTVSVLDRVSLERGSGE